MTNAFHAALSAVANLNRPCTFSIGQPVWQKSHDCPECHIVIGTSRSMFGTAWIIDLVREDDPTGQVYTALEGYLTAQPPSENNIVHGTFARYTRTGRRVSSIEGGVT